MKFGFATCGRILDPDIRRESFFDKNEQALLLNELASTMPNSEWVCVGRTRTVDPSDYGQPESVYNPWRPRTNVAAGIDLAEELAADLDGLVVWLDLHPPLSVPGRVRKIRSEGVATPLQWGQRNVAPTICAANVVADRGKPVLYVLTDPLARMQARDIKWPPGELLTQFDHEAEGRHFRYGDRRLPEDCGYSGDEAWPDPNVPGYWRAVHRYRDIGTDIACLANVGWMEDNDRGFAIIGTEKPGRLERLNHWTAGLSPQMFGVWPSLEGVREAGNGATPDSPLWETMRGFNCTFLVTSESPLKGLKTWPTIKAWECFATGVIAFAPPDYDVFGKIIPLDGLLGEFLRVDNPQQLEARVDMVLNDREVWYTFAKMQRERYEAVMSERRYVKEIRKRLVA